MRAPATIPIEIFAAPSERPMMIAASMQLGDALGEKPGAPWPVRLRFSSFDQPATTTDTDPLVIASLLPDVLADGRSLPAVEAAWRARFSTHLEATRHVFLCTVFRAVEAIRPQQAVLERIRRLNLLVTTLSHEFAATVIDLDRSLAFIGANLLQTDYRLGGTAAAEAGGHAIVTSLLAGTLAGLVPADRQALAVERHGGLFDLAKVVDARLRMRVENGT